jgi:hypothetical protein
MTSMKVGLIGGLVAALCLNGGCSASNGDRSWVERAKGSERVSSFGVFPADGASALRGEQIIVVALDEGEQGVLPEVTVRGVDPDSGEDTRWDADCALSSDGALASCGLNEVLPYYQDFDLDIRVGDMAVVHGVDSHDPEEGLAWAMHKGITVEQFGAGSSLTGLIESSFANDEGVLVLPGWDGQEGTTQLTSGRSDELGDGLVRIDSPGLTMVIDIHITADGVMRGEPVDLFMPVRFDADENGEFDDDEMAILIIYDAVYNGEITTSGLRWTLEGAVDLASVVRVTALYGISETTTLGALRADIDRDDNGIDDALTFRAAGLSPERGLVSWTR